MKTPSALASPSAPWLLIPAAILRGARALTLVLLALLAGAVLAALLSGRIQPPLTLALETGDCPQPCWQGLHPRQMQGEALTRLEQDGLAVTGSLEVHFPDPLDRSLMWAGWQTPGSPSYQGWMQTYSGGVMYLELFADERILLGNAVATLGTPTGALLCEWNLPIPGEPNRRTTLAILYFEEGAVRVWAYRPEAAARSVQPDMQVYRITYGSTRWRGNDPVPVPANGWHGFGQYEHLGNCVS